MSFAIAALALVLLHRADGGVVAVAAPHVTSLHERAPTTGANKVIAREARCSVWLADGKVLSVQEPCDEVRRLLEAAR